MKKKIISIISVMLMFILAITCFAACGGNGDNTDDTNKDNQTTVTKTVTNVEVDTMPAKTEYVVGEEFSVEGGKIKVTYSDGSSEVISMTADGVTVNKPNMNTAASKNIKVQYGNKSVTFKINVATASYNFVYNYGYEGAESKSIKVNRGNKADSETPTRTGYTFYKWYANTDYTTEYDFNTGITADTTIYAFWKKDGATYFDVTFDYDYYGVKLAEYTYPVESGEKVSKPAVTPVRTGYTFDKWVTEKGGNTAFDFNNALTANTTVYAKWTKAVTGTQTYVFEAEDTDLTGKVGPGASGTAQEAGMIVFDQTSGASNDRFVSYLYQKNLSLEFYIASDVAVDNVTLVASLSVEIGDFTFNNSNFQFIVNEVPVIYNDVSISRVDGKAPKFAEFTISTSISLKQGANFIKINVNNSQETPGSTYKAIAPMVDCLKLSTDAVLIWDENHGLPMQGNY